MIELYVVLLALQVAMSRRLIIDRIVCCIVGVAGGNESQAYN